jgi:hypothetical protein
MALPEGNSGIPFITIILVGLLVIIAGIVVAIVLAVRSGKRNRQMYQRYYQNFQQPKPTTSQNQPQEMASGFCKHCGKKLVGTGVFCQSCGQKQ